MEKMDFDKKDATGGFQEGGSKYPLNLKVGEIVTATWKISSNHIQSVLFKTGNNFVNMATQSKVLQQLSSVFHKEQQ